MRKRWLGIREEDQRRPVGGFEDFFFAAFDGIRFFDAFADHKIHHREMAFAQVLHGDELFLVFAV